MFMSLPLDARQDTYMRGVKSTTSKRKHTYAILLMAWVFLIALGVWGTKAYSDHLRSQIATQIAEQNKTQLEAIQQDYQTQIGDLKTAFQTEIAKLQTKVDALNELLAFTKDSANSKTDNSNQLYTQLAEVKKQLEELQHNLDVLK
jgi:peptidoglycan hydrolase CwlO-like protein